MTAIRAPEGRRLFNKNKQWVVRLTISSYVLIFGGRPTRWASSRGDRLLRRNVFEECRRRHEEQSAGDGAAEIQQSVVVAWRPANEHVLQHLLYSARRTGVADEYVPNSPLPTSPNGMLSRTICNCSPSSTMVVSALCAEIGFTASSSSISESFFCRQFPPARRWGARSMLSNHADTSARSRSFLPQKRGPPRR